MSASGLLMLQIAIVLYAAHVLSLAVRRLHQPAVIGKMAAGILLGPSFLGAIAPGLWQQLFRESSLQSLNAVSQVGVVLYMFVVGLRLQSQRLRGHAHLVLRLKESLYYSGPFGALPHAHRTT